jgi:5,10-methylenetetrahydrofolate reductase
MSGLAVIGTGQVDATTGYQAVGKRRVLATTGDPTAGSRTVSTGGKMAAIGSATRSAASIVKGIVAIGTNIHLNIVRKTDHGRF